MKKRMEHSLAFRLLVMILLLIIPMNLLLILMANQIISSVEEDLTASYENELAIYMTRVDDGLQELEKTMNDIVSERWYTLSETYNEGQAEIAKYQFWTRMERVLDDSSIAEVVYLKTAWDNDVVIQFDNADLNYDESQRVTEGIRLMTLESYNPSHFEIVQLAGRTYLMDNINLYSYSFGVLINVEKLTQPMMQRRAFSGEKILLIDDVGQSVTELVEEQVDFIDPIQNLTIEGVTSSYHVIGFSSGEMDYSLVRVMPTAERKSAIPYMERAFQIMGFFSILIVPVLWFGIRWFVLKPLRTLDHAMGQIENENLDYRIHKSTYIQEFSHLYSAFNKMSDRIKHLTIATYEKDIENLEIETTNLRLQMNPHMILNSLNMIYSLAQSKNHELIKKFSIHLVAYFRYVLKKNDQLVPVSQEMEFIKNYLEIQKIRFPGAFTCVYDVDESLYDRLIPPLIIQNFVENSIKYGLVMGQEIEILILVRTEREHMTIAVCDTGNGMAPEILDKLRKGEPIENNTGTHIGIWNCRRRLKVIYGDQANMTITSALGEGTQTWMEMPIRKEGDQ